MRLKSPIISMLLLLMIAVCYSVTAQNLKQAVSIASPNAASLGSYVENPVSHFNGTPGISIPLYQAKEGSLSLPLSLSYNASGVRPDAHPGWTGLNWTLNAGGAITRVVKGIPDEAGWINDIFFSTQQSFVQEFYYGHYFFYNRLQPADWSTAAKVEARAKATSDWTENEPDEFIINVNGYTGKFYIDDQGKCKVVGDPAVKVEIEDTLLLAGYPTYLSSPVAQDIDAIVDSYEPRIRGFKLTLADGTQYEFGFWNRPQTLANASTEGSIDFFQEAYVGGSWDTWYVKRIASADNKQEINFSYEVGDPVASFGRTIAMNKQSGSTTPRGIFGLFGPVSASSFDIAERYNGRIIYPVYLKEISSSGWTITFARSVSQEMPYDYNAIAADLVFQAARAYSSIHYALPARIAIAGRAADVAAGKAGVLAFVRPDINIIDPFTGSPVVSGNVINFLNTDLLETQGKYTGLMTFNGIDVVEAVDFTRIKWYKLDRIDIKSNFDNSVLKSFQFAYNNRSDERLMLLSLTEKGQGTTSVQPYRFEYEDYTTNSNLYPGTEKLPGYCSYKVDHWGFFNGLDSRAGLNFNDEATLIAYKDKRDANPQYLYAGILNKIIYPTGGYVQYTYEPNRYTKTVVRDKATGNFSIRTESAEKTGGGLRIREIRSVPQQGTPIVKTYGYIGGILGGDNQYYWKGYTGKFLESSATYTADRFITQTLLPVSSIGTGGLVGYSKVVDSTNGIGRTEYFFQNHDTNIDENFIVSIDPEKSPYSPFNNKETERGRLIQKLDYNNANVVVRREAITYGANPSHTGAYIKALAIQQIPVFEGWSVEGTAYKIYTYPYNTIKQAVTTFDAAGANPVTVVKDLFYNTNNFIKEERDTTSKREVIRTVTKYPSDKALITTPALSATASTALDLLVGQNNLAAPVEKELFNNGTLVSRERISYKEFYPGIVAPELVQAQTGGTAAFTTNLVYNAYDQKANVLSTSNAGGATLSYIWGYQSSYPVARAENARETEIYYEGFEESTLSAVLKTGGNTGKAFYNGDFAVSFALPNARAYTIAYYYRQGTSWVYTSKPYTGPLTLADGDAIDDVRIYPADALLTTYTYTPLVGVTSEIKPSGQAMYYEYDNMQRLKTIRDHQGNVVKMYCYNYAGQLGNCGDPLFKNVQKQQSFTRNNCAAGGVPGTVTYTVPAGKYLSTESQADADAKALADIAANGQNYANQTATCTFSNAARSQDFTRNNCPAGGTPSTVTYTVPAAKYTSTISQADANAKAQADINANGQNYANQNGTCTFYNVSKSQNFTRNNCTSTQEGTTVMYTVPAGTYTSIISQADADSKAVADLSANGQTYANQNGECWTINLFITTRSGGTTPTTPFGVVVKNGSGVKVYEVGFNEIGKPLPFQKALPPGTGYTIEIASMNPMYAVVNGTEKAVQATQTWLVGSTVNIQVANEPRPVYYNTAMSGTFTRNNCPSGQTGTQVTYSVPAGRYSSVVSQADANAQAQAEINANGQNYANQNGNCVAAGNNVNISVRAGYTAPGTCSVTIKNSAGTTVFSRVFGSIDDGAGLPYSTSIPAGMYTVVIDAMSIIKARVNGSEQTIQGAKSWTASTPLTIELYK